MHWLLCAVCLLMKNGVAEKTGALTEALTTDDACMSNHLHQGPPAAVQAVQIATSLKLAQHPKDKQIEDYSSLHEATHGTSHTATRRNLGIQLASDNSVVADAQVAAYVRTYKQEMKSKQLIYWSHISKSSGTTLCRCGWRNGCKAFGEGKDSQHANCHPLYDWPHWGGGRKTWPVHRSHASDSCEGLSKHASEKKYTLEGNENFLISEGLCPQFWNAMIFREPIDRLLSHLAHLHKLTAEDKHWAEVPTGPEIWNPRNMTPEFVVDAAPIISNNYVIRSLLGKNVYLLPPGHINEMHLARAKQVLEQFDVLYVQDPPKLNQTVAYQNLVEDIELSMGWKCKEDALEYGGDTTAGFIAALRASWTKDDWKKLSDSNYYDIELYKHAALLNRIDKKVLNHPQFKLSLADVEPGKCGYLGK